MKKSVSEIKMPPSLDPYARKEFKRILPLLKQAGYSMIDEPVLICYLEHHAVACRARKELSKGGVVYINEKCVPAVNPYWSIFRQASEMIKKLSHDLGFSSGSRHKLGIQLQEDGQTDDGEEYFGG